VRPCTASARVPAAVVRPCTGFLAPPAPPAPAVESRKNDLEGVLRLEAVKSASYRVGDLLGRRDSSYSFVLIHCLFGTRQQFVDPTGRRGLKCATPTLSDSAGRSPLCGGCVPARNTIAPRVAYCGHVVRAANSSPPNRPSTS